MAEPKKSGVAPVRIVGRIEDVRRISTANGAMFVYLVKLPAPDEYSSPATVRISSRDRVGDVGGTFDQACQVGGYARTYAVTDEETGRKVTQRTADNTLTVVG